MRPDEEYGVMLARHILSHNQRDLDARHPLPAELHHAQAVVNIELRSMVRGICRQISVESADLQARIEEQVREACSEASIDKAIAQACADQLAEMRREIMTRVRRKIEEAIDRAIAERLGDGPRVLAKKVVDKMWDAFSNIGRLGNIYGHRKGARSKKR